MEGVLSAIRSLFKKKKEEEIPFIPPQKIPQQPIVSSPPVSQPSARLSSPPKPFDLGSIVSSISQPIKDYFEPTPQVRARDIVRELPGAAETVARDFIIRPTTRAVLESVMTMGDQNKKVETPKTGIGNYLLGNEPLESIGSRVVRHAKDFEKRGVPYGVGLAVGTPLVMGSTVLDLPGVNLPIGEAKTATKPLIQNADELASVLATEFKKAGDQSIEISMKDLLKRLGEKFEISEKLLDDLDKGVLSGREFSIEKVGNKVEAIFDTFFSPKEIPATKIGGKTAVTRGVRLPNKSETFIGGKRASEEEVAKMSQEEKVIDEMKKGTDTIAYEFGQYADAVREMIGKIRKFGDAVSKKTGLNYREHIAETKAGYSSDEVATGMGISENDLMKRLNDIADSGASLSQKAKDTATKVVEKSRNVTEREFNKLFGELNAFMKERYSLQTPGQFAKSEVRRVKGSAKAQLKLMREAEDVMSEGLVSAEGRGGIQVPFSDLDIKDWKDKNKALLNRETPMRNIEEVAGKNAGKAREFFFDRVAKATQDLENFVASTKKDIESKIEKGLGILPGSEEDKLTFRFGEGRMTLDELKAATPNWNNIIEADKYFRSLYDTLLSKINETITKYGYEPILKRNNYYTHYQDIGNIFSSLGAIARSERLPAWLNGLTADFRPGKQFFKYAQPRLGNEYTESAIGAIDRYLVPAARQIYNTDVIQRGRALYNTIAEAVRKNDELAPTHLADFLAWLDDYVNTLSGKKSLMSRGTEGMFGRQLYGVIDTIKKKTSANLIAGNISAALTNYIPLTQALAATDKPSFFKGLMEAVTHPLTEANNYTIDGIQSSFLRRRFPYDRLVKTTVENIQEKAGSPFTMVDKFTSTAIVTGKYFEGIKNGLSPTEAMRIADEFAMRVIGDRSFGQMPQFFQNQGIMGLFTQFQLEVNNQLSFIFKDLPTYAGTEGSKLKTAGKLAEVAVYSYLFNNIFEWATGRRPAFDPLYTLSKSIEIWSEDRGSVNDKAQKTISAVFDNLPFVSILSGGGRIPLLAGIPSAQELSANPVMAGLKMGLVYGLPAGGYQLYKTIQGMDSYLKGYTETPTGRVKYPVEETLSNLVRSVLFGQYSTPQANRYYEGGETALGEEQSSTFKTLLERDPALALDYYNRVHVQRDIEGMVREVNDMQESLSAELRDPSLRPGAILKLQNKGQEVRERAANLLGEIGVPEEKKNPILELINTIFGVLVPGVEAEETTLKPAGEKKDTLPLIAPKVSGIKTGIEKMVLPVSAGKGSSRKAKKMKIGKLSLKKIPLTLTKPKTTKTKIPSIPTLTKMPASSLSYRPPQRKGTPPVGYNPPSLSRRGIRLLDRRVTG